MRSDGLDYLWPGATLRHLLRGAELFDDRDLEWVKSLTCLKKCGMSIAEMRDYLELCLEGQASIPERKTMLTEKRERLSTPGLAALEAAECGFTFYTSRKRRLKPKGDPRGT